MNEIEQAYPPGHEKYTDIMNIPNLKTYVTIYWTKKSEQGNLKYIPLMMNIQMINITI